jgi:hypothetical protein
MEHWFDRFTKKVASDGMSRRGLILGIGTVAGVAAMSTRVGSAFAQGTRGEVCSRVASRAHMAETRRHTTGALNAHQETSFLQATGATTSILTIDRRGKLVTRLAMQRARDGSVKMTTTYGSEIKGPRSITYDSRDGKSFQKTIDGRPSTGSQPQDAPQIDSNLKEELRSLLTEMKSPAQNCRKEPVPVPPAAHRPVPPNLPLQNRPTAAKGNAHSETASPPGTNRRASFDWHPPQGTYDDAPGCDDCETGCNDDYTKCYFNFDNLVDIITTVVTDLGPQILGKAAVCMADYGLCFVKCQVPGHGCCPSLCGDLGECCGEHETCMLPLQKTCCPANHVVCKHVCCALGTAGCAPDGFCACPSGQTPCGDACCPTGNICCNGACCTAAHCNNNVCSVAPPSAICGGTTCGPFDNCCGGKCCFGTCTTGNVCCPPGQGCGNACCGPGQTCTDPTKGICSSPTTGTCPAGQVECTSRQPGLGTVVVNMQTCCASNVTCCFGRCCTFGQVCCDGGCDESCVE